MAPIKQCWCLVTSTQGIKYPKLRTRAQITLRFAQISAELEHWRDQRRHWREGAAWQTAQPRVLAKVEQHITECEAQLDALRYALNDVV